LFYLVEATTKGGGGAFSGKIASHSISTNALPIIPATTVVFTGKIYEEQGERKINELCSNFVK
jgi:hypothetical protein